MFFKSKNPSSSSIEDFDYLSEDSYYFDSACQSVRPQQVIDAQDKYYHDYNACGHRVKYKWGQMVDKEVEMTRKELLSLVNKSSKLYTVAFGLNTTSGINLILQQLKINNYNKIVTSEIEHNSVFIPTITWARRNNKKRVVLARTADGSLDYKKEDFEKAVVIVNTKSNIDGRELQNVKQLCRDVHEQGGILLLDTAQSFAHDLKLLCDTDFDAAFGSAHKMYAPSLGFIIIRKSLLLDLNCFLLGGSTVQDVTLDDYELVENDDEIYSRIEPGLQNFGGIIALGEAIRWRKEFIRENKNAEAYEFELKEYLHLKLRDVPNITLLYNKPSSIVSLYSDKMDGHKLGMYLSERNIMCRTGYHCCHYYLKHLKKLPPLFRISLGLNNTKSQIDYLVESMSILLK